MLQLLHPALALGALLFAVPLIIHLLNRQRYKRRAWAAMEFLLAAYRKQRRRLRRENLLLLLLRCLIPIVLAFAIARPMLREGGALAGTPGATHHVFVFDHSFSMGLELPGGTTPFERAKTMAGTMLERLDDSAANKVSVVLAGVRPTMPVREDLNVQRARAVVASLPTPVDAANDLTRALLQVAELVEESTDPDRAVYLFTDFQVRAFGDDPFAIDREAGADPTAPTVPQPPIDPADDEATAEMFADTAVDAIQRINDTARLVAFDLRSRDGEGGDEPNVQIDELRLEVPHAIARVPLPIVATLVNRSDTTQTVQVTVDIDGDQPMRQNATLEAGATREVEFQATLSETGLHRLHAQIDTLDGLEADDERFLVVDVRDRLDVLLVDGAQGETDVELRETTHLRQVLDPTDGEGPPDQTVFSPKTIETIDLLNQTERLDNYDLIVLGNVERLDERTGAALTTAVRNGAGLLVMLGANTDPRSYNQYLHGANGDGPMPMRLISAAGYAPGGNQWYGSTMVADDHPVFSDLANDDYRDVFESVSVYRLVRSEFVPPPEPERDPETDEPSPDESVFERTGRVLATVRDPDLSPLLVAGRYGAGKILIMTSALSRRPDRWNEFRDLVIAFPLLHPACHWLTTPATDRRNVLVGASLFAVLDERPFDVAIVLPERAGGTKVPVGDEARPVLGGRYALPPFSRTDHAGFYDAEMLLAGSGGNQPRTLTFAVNPDPDEGILTYFSHARARENLGLQSILTDLPSEGRAAVQAGLSELGPLLLLLTLLLVVGEATLARFIARGRDR